MFLVEDGAAPAMEIAQHFVNGPMFTPPSVRSDDPAGKKGSIVLGIPGRPAPLLTKTLLFIGEGSDAVFSSAGGDKFRAYDKATGHVIWETDLPAGTWVAFSLPSR
jgi:hypothetical protein